MPLPSHAHAAADLGRRALLSALPVLLAWLVMMAGRSHNPVFQAIEAARVRHGAAMLIAPELANKLT